MTVDPVGGLAVGLQNYGYTLNLRDREVFLSFDGGPVPGVTERILAALRDACAKATFFTVGKLAVAAPEVVRQIAADGHTIGGHTMSGASLATLPEAAAVREINDGFAALASTLGRPTAPLFRFPGLATNAAIEARLAKANVGVFSTDASGAEWDEADPKLMWSNIVRRVVTYHGGMILLHQNETTAAALPPLLSELKQLGFKLVAVAPAKPCPAPACQI